MGLPLARVRPETNGSSPCHRCSACGCADPFLAAHRTAHGVASRKCLLQMIESFLAQMAPVYIESLCFALLSHPPFCCTEGQDPQPPAFLVYQTLAGLCVSFSLLFSFLVSLFPSFLVSYLSHLRFVLSRLLSLFNDLVLLFWHWT
jgi:hypothetical protein